MRALILVVALRPLFVAQWLNKAVAASLNLTGLRRFLTQYSELRSPWEISAPVTEEKKGTPEDSVGRAS
jgi:hypothetical protein